MSKRALGFFDYLGLKHLGLLEMLFALTPMLCGFRLGNLPLSVLMWILLLGLVILQGKIGGFKVYRPLLIFSLFWLFHTLIIMFFDDVNTNAFFSQILYFVAVFALYPVLNLNKLKGSLNWVALISIAGLLYQWFDVLRGGMVHPLEIPGLTMSESRLLTDSVRPSSFYMEPAAYVAFMICPLFFALSEKKYAWIIVIIFSIFLSTSTTGLVLSFIMLGVSLLGKGRTRIWTWVVTITIGFSLYYALTTFDVFEYSVEKFQNTEASNIRVSQGLNIVKTMEPQEYVFGVPFSGAYHYCKTGRVSDVIFFGESVFMPTFWELILLYGIVGLVLYLNVYLQILKRNRITLTLVVALFTVLFTSTYSIGVIYIFSLIVLLVVANSDKYSNTNLEKA